MDNGSTVNAVTPEFVKACTLDVGLLNNLVDGTVSVNSCGGLFSQPLGYVVIRIEVEGVWGYDEDQVVPIVPGPTEFGSLVPVILGTLTINQIINCD